jgi:Uma2 family endonuclease
MGVMTVTEPTGMPPGPFTVADLEGMPDDGNRYELLDGVLIVSNSPRRQHQMVVGQLFLLLEETGPEEFCILPAPFAVRPEGHLPLEQQVTELQPDIVVALDASFTDRDLPTAPLLAVEVLSPSTRLFDLTLKRAAYERMGTASYWVLDPTEPDLRAFELGNDGAYRLAAHVRGSEAFTASRPFPVTVRPADLMHRRRRQ